MHTNHIVSIFFRHVETIQIGEHFVWIYRNQNRSLFEKNYL